MIVSLVLNLERSKKYFDLEPPGSAYYYYRYYKAYFEKETGLVVPPLEELKHEENTDSFFSEAGEVNKNKLNEDAKPSEHVEPSELSRPAEHDKLKESKLLGNTSDKNR